MLNSKIIEKMKEVIKCKIYNSLTRVLYHDKYIQINIFNIIIFYFFFKLQFNTNNIYSPFPKLLFLKKKEIL